MAFRDRRGDVDVDELRRRLRAVRASPKTLWGGKPPGFGLPRFVERTFYRYLDCGVLARG